MTQGLLLEPLGMRPCGSSGEYEFTVTHGHFATKKRAYLRIQPAQKKKKKNKAELRDGWKCAETQNRDLGAQLAFPNKVAFNLRPEAGRGVNM